jgi:tight adherence protein C
MKNRGGQRLADAYYAWMRKRGRPAVSETRKARLRAVYPGKIPEQAARELDARRLAGASVCFFAAGLLSLACYLASGEAPETCLERPDGEGAQTYVDLEVEGNAGSFPIRAEVTGRRYTEAELDTLFQEAEEEALFQVLGENASLDEVWGKLNFQTESATDGMTVSWSPRESCLVDADGSITTEVVFGEGKKTSLDMTLRYEAEGRAPVERSREVPIVLVEPRKTPEQAFLERTEAAVRQADLEGRDSDFLALPDAIDGEPVAFSRPSSKGNAGMFFVLGILAAGALLYWEDQKLKEACAKRNRELTLDYGEMVGKLNVLTGAGLPIRQAWERMVREADLKDGKRRYLYEEMALTVHAMEQGAGEEMAYRDFGKRCGLPPYLRLGSLLEANGRKGTKGLAVLLEKEAADAFEERLQLARKQGEEVSSKLLFPMVLLFGLVLVLLMVPAFLAF